MYFTDQDVFYYSDVIVKIVFNFNPLNPMYLEWYSLFLALEQSIQVCRGKELT